MVQLPLPDIAQATILVVDDNPNNLDVVVNFFQQEAFNIAVALNGESALESARLLQPQLILLDVMLPGMSGFELCQHLKEDPSLEAIPIIFMTALHESEYKLQGFAAGGIDYLTKPLIAAELLARVKTHLRLQAVSQQLRQENQWLRQTNQALQTQQQSTEATNLRLQKMIHIDGLTQVANRRCFDDCMEQEWQRLQRYHHPLSLILLDIDYFKAYNDHYGHPEGDRCLRDVAQTLQQLLKRPGDLIARYGGEEFAIVLPHIDTAGALATGKRILEAIRTLAMPHAASPISPWVTASLGISTAIPIQGLSQTRLIKAADQALYQAKNQGRNQLVHQRQDNIPTPGDGHFVWH